MAAKKNPSVNKTAEVDAFMQELDHPLKAEVQALRDIIKRINPDIIEHVKWNAPSFVFQGEDRVTFNLHARDRIQLVFHRGSKVKDTKGFEYEAHTGLLEWVAADRAVVKLGSMEEVKSNKAALEKIVSAWITLKDEE